MASETDWLTKYPEAKQESWLDKYPEATEKPFFDLSDTLSATGRAFTSLGTSVPASMRQAFGGLENPWQRSEGYAQSRADMQALQEELEASDAAAMAGGDASSVSSSIREATPSLGFSGSTLVPSLAAGAVTALATKSPAAARSAAAGTSLLMAYRMAGAQFLDDSRERIDNFFQEKLQRPLTPEEQNEAYEELLPLARKFGAAEAGPEALGNMALGGAGKYIRKALGGKNGIMSLASNALSKVTGAKAVGAGVGAAAGEVGTEAITAVEQDRINKEFEQSVLRGEAPESVVLPDRTVQDYTQGITDVAPTTLAMTGLMGLAGLGPTAINRGYQALRPQAEQQVVETDITPEEPAPAPAPPDGVVTTLPFNREDIRATDLPFNREDIRASELPFTREDIRPTQLPFNREDIRSTELPFSRQNIRGLSQLGQPAISPGLTAAVNTADSIVTTAENTSSDVSQATTAARNIIQGVVDTPQPQEAPVEIPTQTPSPAMEQLKNLSQTITDSNGEIAPEMSVLPPTVQAGAGAGEAIQPQPIETAPDAIIQRKIPENRVEERVQIDEGGPSAAPSGGNRFIEGRQIQEEVAPKKRGRKPALAPQAQEMLAQAAAINAGTQQAAPSTNDFVQKMTGQQPITPQGTPTPATEGTVMPGGSAIERDVARQERQEYRDKNPYAMMPAKEQSRSIALAIQSPEEAAKEVRERWKGDKLSTKTWLNELKVGHPYSINYALFRQKPVSATAVDTYGITLPKGYTRQGDLYVYSPIDNKIQQEEVENNEKTSSVTISPQTTTVAAPTETAAPSAKEAAVASVVQQPVEGSIPTVAEESPVTAIESTEKTDVAKEAMRFLEADLTDTQRAKWTPEMFTAAQAFFDSGGKDFDSLKKAIKFPRVVQQAYLKADKEAAAEQTRREAADAALAREVEKAEKEQAKLEADQKQREELGLKTLNSLIEKTRTNVVQGTVKSSDANQAVAILNKLGAIPNVLFTWIGTSKDFLADPANRARYPETWKAVSSNPNIEGMSENGQPIVFTDNVGVSDLDRNLAKLQGTTPEVAAVRRVILHENIHKGMFFLSLKDKMKLFQFLHRLYSPEELDQLAKSYDEYSDWRINQVSYFSIIEEAMTRDFDSMAEIPRDGIWAEFMQFLRDIWQKITGKTSEPTLKNYKDVFRLIRNSLKNSEKANADRLKNGGKTKYETNDTSVRPYASEGYGSQRMEGVSTGDNSPRAQAIRKAVSESNWNELSPTQRAKALEEFGIQSIQSRYSFDASILPVRVTNERTPKNRPASILSAGPSPAITIQFDTSGLADLLSGDVVTAFANVFDMAQEEVIHAAQHINIYNRWKASKSTDSVGLYELKHYTSMINEVAKIAGDELRSGNPAVANIFTNAWNLYNPNNRAADVNDAIGKIKSAPEAAAFAMELSRMMLQMQRQDFTTETGWMRFVEAMKAMLADITNALRTALAMAKNGQVGKRLQDEISEINALINDLESASQPMASKVTYDSPNEAAFNSGAEVARNADYDERDKSVRSTIRAAYDLAPKPNGPSVPLDQLFDIAKQSMPDLTEGDFSQILQDLYEDSGALLQAGESPFIVTTPDGQRAGSVIIVSSLPTGAMASAIDPESASTKEFTENIKAINNGTLKAAFDGVQFVNIKPVDHIVKPNKSYEKIAIDYVDGLMGEGQSIEQIATSIMTPMFFDSVGASNDVKARQALTSEVLRRVTDLNGLSNTRLAAKRLEKLEDLLGSFWQGLGTESGGNQGQRAFIIGSPRYSWMFLKNTVKKELKQRRENILNVQFGNDNATSFTQNSYENADMAKNISVDESAQNVETTQEDIDLAFGETVLDGEQKTLWERTKDWIRELGIAMRHLAAMDSEAKKSVSDGQRNAITRMSRDEVIAFIDDRKKKISDALKQILGDEAGTNSPVDEMVKIAKKRASKGLTLDALESDSALTKMLREINQARRGAEVPLKNPIPWRKLLSQKAKTVEEYRQRIFDAISANEELKSATPEQKARLADLFTEAWESNRKRILDGMQERLIREKEAKGDLSKKGAEALQEQRMRMVEDINLGIFDNDEIAKIMAEKFGIKSEFTDAEREKIESLIEILQDEKLNRVKRNKAAYELLETLSAQTDISIIKLLANFWVSSVLSGMNTVFSIGMSVFNGMGELTTTLYRIFVSAFSNPKQLPSEVAAAFKTLARVLSAVPRQANRAWQYLVTGDQAFLDPTMNDALKNMDWDSIGKNTQLAEQMAKSDKTLQKVMGIFMRTVSRLLTALDLFNSGLTKEGSLSLVFRQLNLDPAKIEMLEKKSDLKAYKAQVIRDYFNNVQPKTLNEKALVESYAMAEMMKELDELGSVSENADQMAMQGAMTLDPSGIGGYGYRFVKLMMKSAESGADKLVERNLRKWDEAQGASDKTEAGVKLALSYIFQFAAYNAANLVGVRFARFAGNKFNQSLSFLPIIGALRLYEAEFDADRIRGKEAFTDMIKRNQLTGVMAAAIGYVFLKAIAEEPDDEKRGWFINGGWSNLTPEKKQQKLASGQKEYTLGFGDTVINYGNWPGSGIIAAIGGLSDLIHFSPEQWSEKTVSNKLMSATASGVFSALEVPALSQFQELFGSSLSSKDPNEQKLTKFARVIGNYAGGFVPRILKDIDYLADPNFRKYETLWEKTASHIPVYRRYEGKEYYDILGQQIQRNVYPGSREFMVKPTDPAYKVLGALNSRGIWLTPANAEHRMVGKGARRRSLTQEEADNYSLETGKGYKQMLLRYGQRALQMPTERAKAFLLDKADDVRDRALKKVYRGYTPAS